MTDANAMKCDTSGCDRPPCEESIQAEACMCGLCWREFLSGVDQRTNSEPEGILEKLRRADREQKYTYNVRRVLVEAADEIERLQAVKDAAKDLFPPKAKMWDSPRMDRLRRVLAAMGEDPAPAIPFYKEGAGRE